MAYAKRRANWLAYPDTSTPIRESDLDAWEQAIFDVKTQYFNVKDYGAIGNGSADDSSAVQAAITACASAGGGIVFFPKGDYRIATTLTVGGDNVILEGVGWKASRLTRTTDVTVLEISGVSSGSRRWNVEVRDLGFDASTRSYDTNPFVKCKWLTKCRFERCFFNWILSSAVKIVECWDCRFYDCFWQDCGGNNGARPAVEVRSEESGTATDSSNNMWFVNCHFESFRDGAIWFIGTSSWKVNKCYLVNTKIESRKHRGTFVKLDHVSLCSFVDLNVAIGEWDASYSTADDGIKLTNSYGIDIKSLFAHGITNADAYTRSYVSFGSGCSWCTLRDATFETAGSTNDPTVAAIEFTGSPDDIIAENCRWSWNPGDAPLYSGAPNNQRIASTVVPVFGSSVDDTDFVNPGGAGNSPPLKGTVALDSSNGRLYVKYPDGSWHYATLT